MHKRGSCFSVDFTELRMRVSHKPHLYLLILEGLVSVVPFREGVQITATICMFPSGNLRPLPRFINSSLHVLEKPFKHSSSFTVSAPIPWGGDPEALSGQCTQQSDIQEDCRNEHPNTFLRFNTLQPQDYFLDVARRSSVSKTFLQGLGVWRWTLKCQVRSQTVQAALEICVSLVGHFPSLYSLHHVYPSSLSLTSSSENVHRMSKCSTS